MIRILGVNCFPIRVFLLCMDLAIVAALVPRFFIVPIVAGGALWIERDEVRRLQMHRSWDR
jgi:hypothetical protein